MDWFLIVCNVLWLLFSAEVAMVTSTTAGVSCRTLVSDDTSQLSIALFPDPPIYCPVFDCLQYVKNWTVERK